MKSSPGVVDRRLFLTSGNENLTLQNDSFASYETIMPRRDKFLGEWKNLTGFQLSHLRSDHSHVQHQSLLPLRNTRKDCAEVENHSYTAGWVNSI